jgi:hypothetical protein
MISKRDYLQLFQQILAIEVEMEKAYGDIIKDLARDKYKKAFHGLMEAEKAHQTKVLGIMKYFEDKK